jgi:hypothetical protein
MRSKWLEWTPDTGFVGFEGPSSVNSPGTRASEECETELPIPSRNKSTEKSVQGQLTKPTEPTPAIPHAPLIVRPPHFWGRHGDYYGWRTNVALDAICAIPSPEGLIVWLGEHSPFLYQRLTRDLPNEISRAWDAQIPLVDFDAVCLDLVDTYRRAAELFRG